MKDNFLEYVKVRTKEGKLIPLRFTRMQMKVWNIIQDRLKKGGRLYPILRGRSF